MLIKQSASGGAIIVLSRSTGIARVEPRDRRFIGTDVNAQQTTIINKILTRLRKMLRQFTTHSRLATTSSKFGIRDSNQTERARKKLGVEFVLRIKIHFVHGTSGNDVETARGGKCGML